MFVIIASVCHANRVDLNLNWNLIADRYVNLLQSGAEVAGPIGKTNVGSLFSPFFLTENLIGINEQG